MTRATRLRSPGEGSGRPPSETATARDMDAVEGGAIGGAETYE